MSFRTRRGPAQTLELLAEVDSPYFLLCFDTGNPVARNQDSWDYYTKVKNYITYIHIKDAKRDGEGRFAGYCFPGEGAGYVQQIITDLVTSDYQGCISIEPHVAAIYHEQGNRNNEDICYQAYIRYGRNLVKMIEEVPK